MKTAICISILIVISLAISGCTPKRRLILLGVDNSGSTEDIRDDLVSMAYELGTELNPSSDKLILYRFAATIQEVATNIDDDEIYSQQLDQYVKPTAPGLGTDYSKVLKRLADVSTSRPENDIRLVVAGDGFTDSNDPEVPKRFQEAASELAANPKVKLILFYGAKPGSHELIEKYFAGAAFRLEFCDARASLPPSLFQKD